MVRERFFGTIMVDAPGLFEIEVSTSNGAGIQYS